MIVLRAHETGNLINSKNHPDVNFVFREVQDFIYYRRFDEHSETGGKVYCVLEGLIRFGVKFHVSVPTPLQSETLATDFIIQESFEFKDLRMADELGFKRALPWNYLVEDYIEYEIEEPEREKIKLALIDLIKDNTPT